MKLTKWVDEKGRTYRSVLPDVADEKSAEYGIPGGPPNLDQLDWEQIKSEINEAMVKHDLWTWEDVQRSPDGVGIALSIFKRHVISLYRSEWNVPNNGGN